MFANSREEGPPVPEAFATSWLKVDRSEVIADFDERWFEITGQVITLTPMVKSEPREKGDTPGILETQDGRQVVGMDVGLHKHKHHKRKHQRKRTRR